MADEDTSAKDTAVTPPAPQDTATPTPDSASQTPADDAAPATLSEIVADAKAQVAPDAGGQPDGSVSAPAEPDAAPAAGGFLASLKEAGFAHDYADDAAAAKAFMELREKLSQRDQLAQIGQSVLPDYQAFQDFKKGQQAAPAQAKDLPWNPPHEFNPAWIAELQKAEDDRNPAVMQQYNDYFGYADTKWRQWTMNPNQFVEEMVVPAIEARVGGMREEQETQRQVSRIIDENKELATKYETQITQMLNEGVPLNAAMLLCKKEEELIAYRTGKPPAAAITPTGTPAAAAGNKEIPAGGIVTQTPAPQAEDSEKDIQRWANAREAGKDALAAMGHTPPGSI